MKEHPILFSAPMVRAILDVRKGQTRRVLSPRNSIVGEGHVDWSLFDWAGKSIYVEAADWPGSPGPAHRAPLPFVDGKPFSGQYLHVPWNWAENGTIYRIYPRYEVGDHLWVREAWQDYCPLWDGYWCGHGNKVDIVATHQPIYRAAPPSEWQRGPHAGPARWRPGIFMPRWASRLTLAIHAIRVQQLQDISEADAIAEGCPEEPWYRVPGGPLKWFSARWDSIYGRKHSWASNPWVWVNEFGRSNEEVGNG